MSSAATAVRVAVLAGLVLGAAAVGTAGSTAGSGTQATEIDGCTTIDQPGRYVITDNQTYGGTIGSTACITVVADDVVIDGQGSTFDGRGISNTTAIRVAGGKNVVVRNLVVADWHYGVHYLGADDGAVRNVTFRYNVYGAVLDGADGVSVTNDRFDRNLVGLRLNGTERNDVRRDNRFQGNQVAAMHQRIPLRGPTGSMIGPPTDHDGDMRFRDVNGDGTVNRNDRVALGYVALADLVGGVDLSPDQEAALDANGDGNLDVFDAVATRA